MYIQRGDLDWEEKGTLPTAGQTDRTLSGKSERHVRNSAVAVLVGLMLLAVALFVVTTLYSRAYRRMQEANGRHWYERGQSDLKTGHPLQAAIALRNAIAFRRDPGYFFRLAQALVAAGHYEEARGYLLNLWEQQPGRGDLNLELARLEAKTGKATEAVRYYQNAIYGVWNENPEQHRIDVRFELAEFLLSRDDKAEAEADLIALTPNLPPDPAEYIRTAKLFLAANDNQRALLCYQQAAKLAPDSAEALAGAGNTAFALGNYALARSYLERAFRLTPSDKTVETNLQIAENVLKMDPFQSGVSGWGRASRTVAAWKQAISSISACTRRQGLSLAHNAGPQSPLLLAYSNLAALRPNMRESKLIGAPEIIETALARIAAAENATAATCGPLSPPDVALQLIGRAHGVSAQ
jgi:tetratricopeptide (TPR) repeat protein